MGRYDGNVIKGLIKKTIFSVDVDISYKENEWVPIPERGQASTGPGGPSPRQYGKECSM